MTFDLTQIVLALIAGFFGIATPIILSWIYSHIKNVEARDIVQTAVKNSLGMLQEAAASEIETLRPHFSIPDIPVNLVPAVRYVLDSAEDSMKRLGVTAPDIAQKVVAQLGLANIATNLATTASAATPAVVAPLAKVVETGALASLSRLAGGGLNPV